MVQSPETGTSTLKSVETGKLIVRQPAKLEALNQLLMTFENLNARVGERATEDNSGGMGSGSSGASQGSSSAQSPRDFAISKMPVSADVVRSQISAHVEKEVQSLEKQARRLAKWSWKKGTAHQLNELYSRIRRLNSLLSSLVEASYEMMKRLYIRIFIDHQPIL